MAPYLPLEKQRDPTVLLSLALLVRSHASLASYAFPTAKRAEQAWERTSAQQGKQENSKEENKRKHRKFRWFLKENLSEKNN
jgi:hypothetical protein